MMKKMNYLVAKTKDRKKEKKRLTFFLLALRRLEEWPWIPVDCQFLERNKTSRRAGKDKANLDQLEST